MRPWGVRSCAPVILALTGCNQIYGLDPTQLERELPVTGQLIQRWVENDIAGRPIVLEEPLHIKTDVYIGVRIGSTFEELDIAADGSFRFMRDREDTPYQLVITQDGELHEIHHDAPSITFVSRSAGRHDAEPQSADIKITFPRVAGTTSGAVASTGIWAYNEQLFGTPFTLEWRRAAASGSRHGLIDTNRNDRFYYLDFGSTSSRESLQYSRITGAQSISPLKMGRADINIDVAPPRVTATECSTLTGALGLEGQRLRSMLPAYTAAPFDAWTILAVPDLEVGVAGGITLAGGLSIKEVLTVTPAVVNPIEHSKLAAVALTSVERELKHPRAVFGKPERASILHLGPLDCSAPTTTVVPPTSIGIPVEIRLEDIALDRDDVDIVVPDRDLELAWSVTSGAPIDWYTAVLYQVRAVGLADLELTVTHAIRSFQTVEPRLSISPIGLVRGAHYILEIRGFVGLPDAKTGDLRQLTYPFSIVQLQTGMFRLR